MKLLYYDDVTPPDYQPTFFQDAPHGICSDCLDYGVMVDSFGRVSWI